MEEGRRKSCVQTAYPHCHLLLMTADKLLMQIPSERLQLPHPQPSLTISIQENPSSNNPFHPATYSEWSTLENTSSLTVCSKRAVSFKTRKHPALQSHDGREQWFKLSRWWLWHPHAAKHMLTRGCYSECHLLVVESNYWLILWMFANNIKSK